VILKVCWGGEYIDCMNCKHSTFDLMVVSERVGILGAHDADGGYESEWRSSVLLFSFHERVFVRA